MFCLAVVGLGVEEAPADVLATPLDHNVDLSVDVDERHEGDHRCIGKIWTFTKKDPSINPRGLAGEQKFSHVLIPQDVMSVKPEVAVFHVVLRCIDLQKRDKKELLYITIQNENNRSSTL